MSENTTRREPSRDTESPRSTSPLATAVRATALFLISLQIGAVARAGERTISRAELIEKISGYWLGQLVGNYMGFPFENVYQDEPLPVLVDRYYNAHNAGDLRLNDRDARGYVHILATAFEGAFSDDDTDIELVVLHAVEKHGLDVDYLEMTEEWKEHINRRIWVANRKARDLMDEGLVPPATGSKENNPHWFQIDPQLVNEIWSVFYPGLTRRAAERAEWGARITSEDWGTHPTIAYAVMYSAAFFETDPETLVRMALAAVPEDSPFSEGVRDLLRWRGEDRDWREARRLLHEKYYRYSRPGYEAPVSPVSSLINGLAGVMSILWGEGDFMRTAGIAVSAGYDCDNQAATAAGLIGVMHGAGAIPERMTREVSNVGRWDRPFNDLYVNYTRDNLPVATRITEIVERIASVTETAILTSGGHKREEAGGTVYTVNCDF